MIAPHVHLRYRSISISMVALVAVAAFLSGVMLARPAAQTGSAQAGLTPDDIMAATNDAMAGIYERAAPSVVKIEVERPPAEGQEATGTGSGFVWDDAGHIVTNWHVVRDATAIRVGFSDGTSLPGEMHNCHPLADLAVVRVNRPAAELHPVALGKSADVRVGEIALAIGCPYGQDFTLTRGIVSAVNRTIRTCESCYPISDVIQTDTPINPGSSGGPLFNHRGEVIGVNTMMVSRSASNTGVSFAVSVDTARQIVPALIAGDRGE